MKRNLFWSDNMWKLDDEVGCENCSLYWDSDGVGCHASGKRFSAGYCDYFEKKATQENNPQLEYDEYMRVWN